MTTPQTARSGVGLRWVQVFALNTYGSPLATGTTAYEGVQVEGSKALTITLPESRDIVYQGDDIALALDMLPSQDGASGQLTAGKTDDTLEALLTGNKSFTIGDGESMGMLLATDNQGKEPLVGMLAYRQAVDDRKGSATYGQRVWEWYIFPKTWVVPSEAGFNDSPTEKTYKVRPQIVRTHLWETAFTTATEGATQGQVLRGISVYEPKLVSFVGNNTVTAFLFPTTAYAAAATKMTVWVNGVNTTTGITKATTGVTFTTAPTTNARIEVFYEKAA